MNRCMVLYAEGPGDHGRPPLYAAPGDSLLDEDLGPAHFLVRRAIQKVHRVPPEAVDFRAPYKTRRGEALHGSRLLNPRLLREALAGWRLNPALVVLLVDADEEPPEERRAVLRAGLEGRGLEGAVGVAVQEFESWLIADQSALQEVLGSGHVSPGDIEGLSRRQAKDRLTSWTERAKREGRGTFQLRIELAKEVDLDVLEERCPSFGGFLDEIRQLSFS